MLGVLLPGNRSSWPRWTPITCMDAIFGFCETTKCRREVLLGYFDDSYLGPCENCDTCLAPSTKQINATPLAIEALRAVYETKQKYNVQYMVNRHEGEQSLWFSVYRQLIAQGHLKMLMDGKSELKLTRKAITVLEGKEEVFLRADYKKTALKASAPKVKKVAKKKTKRSSVAAVSKDFIKADGTDQTLFENLKILGLIWRKLSVLRVLKSFLIRLFGRWRRRSRIN